MRIATAVVLLSLCPGSRLSAGEKGAAVGWTELATYVNGMKFATVLEDGTKVEGRAISVVPEGLAVNVSKSSGKLYGKGRAMLPRVMLSSIDVLKSGKKFKIIDPIVGCAGVGVLGGVVGVARGGPLGAGAGLLGGMVVGGVIGELVGIHEDHYKVTIRIAK